MARLAKVKPRSKYGRQPPFYGAPLGGVQLSSLSVLMFVSWRVLNSDQGAALIESSQAAQFRFPSLKSVSALCSVSARATAQMAAKFESACFA